MKDYCSFLLRVSELLKTQDNVTFIVNGITVNVAWELPNSHYTEIHIEHECDESGGIVYKIGKSDEARTKILEFDKVDYFNQNLVTPMILELDEMKKVLLAFCDLEKHYYVLVSESVYSIIDDKL